MKGYTLELLVFFYENQILNPLNFVMDFCSIWEEACLEPFKLHKNRALIPATEITEECFIGGKPDFRKGLMLKSSFKRNHDEVIFMFEVPGKKRITAPDFKGYQEPASSIAISIPFDKTKANSNYSLDKLFQIFLWLLSNGAVENASVNLMSDVYWEVREQISDVLKNKKENAIIERVELAWATFFTVSEYQKIVQRFAETGNSLAVFCEENGLEILTSNNFDGAIMKVKKPLEDSPDYFYSMLKRTREFYSVLEPDGQG